MKQCWPEGDLRAYLDRELAPDEMERAAAHLAECPECSGRCDALSATAQRVSAWMTELTPAAVPVAAPPRPARAAWKFAAAALATAAAIVIAITAAAHRDSQPARTVHVAPVPAVQPDELVPRAHEAVIRPERPRRPRARGPIERTENFVALDNEPFEAGWVVRMALGPDQIQADVVFSADGRARAYRLVSNSSN